MGAPTGVHGGVDELCVAQAVAQWVEAVPRELATPAPLVSLMRRLPRARWPAPACLHPTQPYARRVLHQRDGVEVMLAGWSRARPCAPHDHGPGLGAVRVLQGRALHRRWVHHDGRWTPQADEVLPCDEIIECPRGLVHQMQDGGGLEPLVTLHVYVGDTAPMAVLDLAKQRTQWLAGGGAWIHDEDHPNVLGQTPIGVYIS